MTRINQTIRKHVQMRINNNQRKYVQPPKGINILWYPQTKDDIYNGVTNATVLAVPYNSQGKIWKNDINNYLNTLPITSDRVRENKSLRLINQNIRTKTIAQHPFLTGENDFLISKILNDKKKMKINIPPISIKEINKIYNKKIEPVQDLGVVTDL
jgi:hypothetical protein